MADESPANEENLNENASKQEAGDPQKETDGSPVNKITKIVLIVCAVIFIWYLAADRFAPFTSQARTKMLVLPVTPRVSGYLTDINAQLDRSVSAGQVLFQIDKRPYELAVNNAEANVELVTQQVAAMTATVKSAAGRVGTAKAQLDRSQRYYKRTQDVLKKNPGALSQADIDRAETGLAQSLERLVSAEADLEKAKQQLGTSGENNPQLKSAIIALEQANYDLEMTTLHAPVDGSIENMYLEKGYYAAAGKPLCVLIPKGSVWIQADFRENNLEHLDLGDDVDFALDIAPGRVFKGKVRSVSRGVSSGEGSNRGDLQAVSSTQAWLNEPQRFPVIISIDDEEAVKLMRSGGQADVIVYASCNFILNAIGWLQIRISSWLSYVR